MGRIPKLGVVFVADFFTDVTVVNQHFSPPFGRICFGTFSKHQTSKSK